jgi:hypothetical protein
MITPCIRGSDAEITPNFGFPPFINGKVDSFLNEWGNARSEIVPLKTGPSDEGLNVTVSSIVFFEDLYILCQYELEPNSVMSNEFLGLLISEGDTDNLNNLTDGRIVQLSNSQDSYKEYLIEGFNFTRKLSQDRGGTGAGTNNTTQEDKIMMSFEFKIPLNLNDPNNQKLEFGNNYTFFICQGNNFSLAGNDPEGIIRNNTISINLEEPNVLYYLLIINLLNPPEEINYNQFALLVIKIIIFSIVYISFLSFSLIYLIKFKKKVRRIKKR